VTSINLAVNQVGAEVTTTINALTARNKRLRHLFLFDARQQLLSVLCADECGVVWPYLLAAADADYVAQPSNRFGDSNRCVLSLLLSSRSVIVALPLLCRLLQLMLMIATVLLSSGVAQSVEALIAIGCFKSEVHHGIFTNKLKLRSSIIPSQRIKRPCVTSINSQQGRRGARP
jgi:hypothetical protein